MEPEPPFLLRARADPIWSELESAPRPRTSEAGAAQKSGGSATLTSTFFCVAISQETFRILCAKIKRLMYQCFGVEPIVLDPCSFNLDPTKNLNPDPEDP